MDYLLLAQFGSLLLTFFVGFMLALSRIHSVNVVRRYEVSRWTMVCAMGIYFVHYLLQMVLGLRASGDDVGAVVNILFYAPVTYLLSFSIVNLSSGSRYLKRHLTFSIISYSAILATFIVGLSLRHSLHMGPFMYLMGAEFFASVVFAVADPLKESRRIRRELESDTAGDLSIYNKFMRTGTILVLIVGLLVPSIIFSRALLLIIGPIFLIALFVYAVNFVCMGFSLQSVVEVLDANEGNQEDVQYNESDEDFSSIQAALDAWLTTGNFSNPEMSLNKLAQNVGCSAQELSHFITRQHGVTFRIWLSKIRLEEAKRILIDKPEATIEAVAEDCGFTSRSYFQNLFKAETGYTPREWRSRNVLNQETT